MTSGTPLHRLEPDPTESADLFDYQLIRDYLGYALRSAWRRKFLALFVVVAVVGATAGALAALPKTYHVETKILAQRNQVMSALGNPGRGLPFDADAPTKAAGETVLRRDNLVALIKQTDLVDNWDRTRAPALRLKDWAVKQLKGPATDDDKLDALIGLLEKKLTVETGNDTVTISIDWPDAQMAYRLVEAAQQNFLETRHVTEISVISEAISILEGHAANVHDAVASLMEEIQTTSAPTRPVVQAKLAPGAKPPAPVPAVARAPAAPKREDQESAQLQVMLNAKRQAIRDVEEFRQRRLTELQAQLTEQKAVYAPAHPLVLNTQQSIDAMSQQSPQVAQLRKEAQELEAELAKRTIKLEQAAPAAAEPRQVLEQAMQVARKPAQEGEDVNLDYLRSRLRVAMQQYDSLLERIDSARIELDTARAAFKYRYSVVRPAQLPKKAEKPKVPVVLGGGCVAALALAVLATLLADLRAARLEERWQVERQLGLKLLGHLDRG